MLQSIQSSLSFNANLTVMTVVLRLRLCGFTGTRVCHILNGYVIPMSSICACDKVLLVTFLIDHEMFVKVFMTKHGDSLE